MKRRCVWFSRALRGVVRTATSSTGRCHLAGGDRARTAVTTVTASAPLSLPPLPPPPPQPPYPLPAGPPAQPSANESAVLPVRGGLDLHIPTRARPSSISRSIDGTTSLPLLGSALLDDVSICLIRPVPWLSKCWCLPSGSGHARVLARDTPAAPLLSSYTLFLVDGSTGCG